MTFWQLSLGNGYQGDPQTETRFIQYENQSTLVTVIRLIDFSRLKYFAILCLIPTEHYIRCRETQMLCIYNKSALLRPIYFIFNERIYR